MYIGFFMIFLNIPFAVAINRVVDRNKIMPYCKACLGLYTDVSTNLEYYGQGAKFYRNTQYALTNTASTVHVDSLHHHPKTVNIANEINQIPTRKSAAQLPSS